MSDRETTDESGGEPNREALRDHAREEAKRIKADVQGDTEALRTQRAILDRERELSGFEVEYQQAQQQISEAQSEIERIRETMRRLGESPEREVMERLPDGTLMAVPDGARDAFVSRLNTKLSEAQSRLKQQRERADSIQRGLMTNKLAIEWLEDNLEGSSDSGGCE